MFPAAHDAPLRFGEFTFDRAARLLRRGSDEIPLPPRVLAVLELLLDRAGDVVPRQAIIERVWQDAFVTDTSLAEAVSFLRQSLGDDPQSPTYVQTVHRRGYRFVAKIEPVQPGRGAPPDGAPPVDAAVEPGIGRTLLPWSMAALCALAAAVALWQLTGRPIAVPPIVRFEMPPPAGTTFDARAPAVAISPDGRLVAFVACGERCQLYIRGLDALTASPVSGTNDAAAPFFSPDSRWVAFFAEGKLKKVGVSGGTPIPIVDAPQTFGGAWLPDAAIVYADSLFGGLKRVSDSGGSPIALTRAAPGEIGHAWPAVLPDGGAILFTASTSPLGDGRGPAAIVPYEPGSNAVRTARLVLGPTERIVPVGREYLAYGRRDNLYAVPFDRARLAAAGREQPTGASVMPRQFAVSSTGTLAVVPLAFSSEAAPAIQTSTSTATIPLPGQAIPGSVTLSPDGRRIAFVNDDDDQSDVWIMDLDRRTTLRLTHGGTNVAPVWSQDGASVYYAAQGASRFEIWRRDAGGIGEPVRIAARDDAHLFPTSEAGDRLAATEASTGANICLIPLGGGGESVVVSGSYDDVAGALSPDGRLLAYQSDESGRWEVYLLRLSDKQRTAVSAGGGASPFWAPDGATLYFTSPAGLMRATVADDAPAPAIAAAALPAHARPIGMARDGVIRLFRERAPMPAPAVVTLEWARELRQLLGPPGTALPR